MSTMSQEKTIFCQGLPCPQPVLKCKEAIDSENPVSIKVLVDNDPALENVSRFLGLQGYHLHQPVRDENSHWVVTATRSESPEKVEQPSAESSSFQEDESALKILVFLTRDKIGSGNDELGEKLMLSFLSTLPELGSSLWRIVLVNSGVKLAVQGNPALESLQSLEKNNVSLLVCGTCLEFFGLTPEKKAGQTTNMLDVVTSMSLADKVISI